jgi:hypothetical protein
MLGKRSTTSRKRLYSIIRYQGRFSTKFPLEKYPFDTQVLTVSMADTVSGAASQIYVPDGEHPVTLDPVITLPGFKFGEPTMRVVSNTYPTNFGDISAPEAETYSRIVLSIRSPGRSWLCPADAGRAPTRLRRVASRCRLSDDAR